MKMIVAGEFLFLTVVLGFERRVILSAMEQVAKAFGAENLKTSLYQG
jgi:hypothetical protein